MEDEYAMGLKNSYMPVKRPYLIDDADGTEKERINIQILGCITKSFALGIMEMSPRRIKPSS